MTVQNYPDAKNWTQYRKRDINQITTRTISVYDKISFIKKITLFKNLHFLPPIKIYS